MANKEVILHAFNYCGLLCISVQMHPDMLFTCAFSFLPSIAMSGNIPYRMMMVMTAVGLLSVYVGILDDCTLKQMSYCLHVE